MPKGLQRNNREPKKPKKDKPKGGATVTLWDTLERQAKSGHGKKKS